nr:hypothetical protein [Tanacetum cinerariifolium]
MTNKIDTVLKAITDQMADTLPRDTVKNPKLSISLVLSARSYLNMDPQCSSHIHNLINAMTIHPKSLEGSQVNRPDKGQEEEGNIGNTNFSLHPKPDPLAFIAIEQDDGEVMFIEIIRDNDEPQNEGPNDEEGAKMEGAAIECFDRFPTTDELTYYKIHETYKNVSQDIRDQLNAEAEAVQIILIGIDNDIYSTVDACPDVCEMWKAIKRLKQGESINVQDLETNIYWEFGKFTSKDGGIQLNAEQA